MEMLCLCRKEVIKIEIVKVIIGLTMRVLNITSLANRGAEYQRFDNGGAEYHYFANGMLNIIILSVEGGRIFSFSLELPFDKNIYVNVLEISFFLLWMIFPLRYY